MKSVRERFWSKVDRSGGPDACWPWMAARNEHGYGVMRIEGRNVRAHRVSLTLAAGKSDPGPSVKVLHSCDNPPCCNPAHLRYGTQGDNIRDAIERGRRVYPAPALRRSDPKPPAGRFSYATHCVHGHPFDSENTLLKPNPRVRSGFERACIACRQRNNQRSAARRKAARQKRKVSA